MLVHHTVEQLVMKTGPGASPHKPWSGEGRAEPWIPALCTASPLFNVCLYVCSSVLSINGGVFDQKQCTDKIETYIYKYTSLLPA